MSLAFQAKSKIERLYDRAAMLKRARLFFDERGVVEVDCPILSQSSSIDPHIDLISALYSNQTPCYMHSSPEYGMKRLLSLGMKDIFQISHVFRDGELSAKHNPEFTLAEWYRVGLSFEDMIEETLSFIRLFLGPLPSETISYRALFLQEAGIDYLSSSTEDLLDYLRAQNIPFWEELQNEGKDAVLNLILGAKIEPVLGRDTLTVLSHYPSSQSALAQKRQIGEEEVAERFEVYYKGIELANGYHELTDAVEQRKRLIEANQQRQSFGKAQLPIDERFLAALASGMPNCCGVAVGFDRLMMLRHGQSTLSDVIAWSWQEA